MKIGFGLVALTLTAGLIQNISAEMAQMPESPFKAQNSVFMTSKGELVLDHTVMPGNSDERRDAAKTAAAVKSVNAVDELYMVSKVEGRRDQGSSTQIRKVEAIVMGPDNKPIAWEVKSDAGIELVDAKHAGAKNNVTVGSHRLIEYLKNNTTGKLDISRRTLSEMPYSDQSFVSQIRKIAETRPDFARTNLKDWKGTEEFAQGQQREKMLAARTTKGANGLGEVNAATRRANASFQEATSLDGIKSIPAAAEKATSDAIREH